MYKQKENIKNDPSRGSCFTTFFLQENEKKQRRHTLGGTKTSVTYSVVQNRNSEEDKWLGNKSFSVKVHFSALAPSVTAP